MPSIRRASTSGSGRASTRRTILNYVATCRTPDCEFLPRTPREASAHCIAEGHTVTETKSYVVEVSPR